MKILQILYPNIEHCNLLIKLFNEIIELKEDKKFHPHEFTYEFAYDLCTDYVGKDLYYIMLDSDIDKDDQIIAYGLLRGWDNGYKIPCLGIYVSKNYRGKGFSKLLMNFLHLAAKNNGAEKIRLKVYKDNVTAVRLYKSFGYEFSYYDNKQYLGIKTL
jgi:ribosomal-protein-alanine N-acetyltransferase